MQLWTSWQPNQKQARWDDLCEILACEMTRQEATIASFEERITGLIELGATDRTMAIGWLMQAHGVEPTKAGMAYAREELEFEMGLPFGYLARGN